MIKKLYILSSIFLSAFLFSCQEDLAPRYESVYESPIGDGLTISASIDIPEVRSRDIDMAPGATLYLKNIWVGAYRKRDGKRIAGTLKNEVSLGDRMTASNATIIDLVKLDLKEDDTDALTYDTGDTYCVVGIVNYDGVKTTDGADLITKLKAADNWCDFVKIAIDTQKSVFELQRPMLMGYMYQESILASDNNYTYAKVNQFATAGLPEEASTNLPVNLFGNDAIASEGFLKPLPANLSKGAKITGITTKYNDPNDGNKVKNYVLKLRRMRSKINIVINDNREKGVTVTSTRYRIHNNPGSAFLAQRRTNTFSITDLSDSKYSPNSPDIQSISHESDRYVDLDWQTAPDNYNFSFEHFENKHWALSSFKDDYNSSFTETQAYHLRETKNDSGKFAYLTDSDVNAWNNNASYFELELGVNDALNGVNGLVTYTIHEGFCNDPNGIPRVDENGNTSGAFIDRLMDFSCIRNTDYYYYITVNGVDDIHIQVTNSSKHTVDGKGSIWHMDYVIPEGQLENFITTDDYENGKIVELNGDKKLTFDDTDPENIAFRFIGALYDEEMDQEENVDICYNFRNGQLDGFIGLWPAPSGTTEYIADQFDPKTGELTKDAYIYWSELFAASNKGDNIKKFLKMMDLVTVRIYGRTDFISIQEYIDYINTEKDPVTTIDAFKFQGYKLYDIYNQNNAERRSHLRGLYIFDREKAIENGKNILMDDDKCSFLYEINGAEQYPVYLASQTDEMFYVTGSKSNYIPAGTAGANPTNYTDFNNGKGGSGVLLSDNPEIAFRLLGYDGNTQNYYDICYNFDLKDFPSFISNGDWPQQNLNNIVTDFVDKGRFASYDIPQSFLDGMKVIANGNVYNLKDFVYNFENGTIPKNAKIGIQVGYYEKKVYNDDLRSKMRALYIFDKKNPFHKPAIINTQETEATYHVFAAEQYPTRLQPQQYPAPTNIRAYTKATGTIYNFVGKPTGTTGTTGTIGTIVIPKYTINGVEVPLSDYKYRIIGGTTTNNYYMDVEGTPEADGFHVILPMKIAKGQNGDLYLQVISQCEEYTDSPISTSSYAGSYSFTKLNDWKINDGGDWDGALKNIAGKSYYDGTFLHFSCSNNTFSISDAGKGIISFGGTSRFLKFKIYKPCKISVGANRNGNTDIKRKLNITLDNGITKDAKDLPTEKDKIDEPVSWDITADDFKGVDVIEVTLSSANSGINIGSVALREL